jgi:transmembrane sensor
MVNGQAMSTSNDPHPGSSPLDDEAYEWMARFISGRASRSDLAGLRQWVARSQAHAEAFERVSRTWASLGPVGETLTVVGVISRQLPYRVETAAPVSPGMGRRALLGGALAASAVGAAAVVIARPPLDLWPSWSELAADYRTTTGERRQITLADRVSIDMNTRTSIVLRSRAEAEIIAGEAMISARSNASEPFTLLATDGRIAAADARVNVRVEGRTARVTCVTGTVQVEQRSGAVLLPAGQQVLFSPAGMGRAVAIDAVAVSAWQNGIIIFQSTPISDVVAEVNRYRPGRIVLTSNELGRRLFNARLRIENIGRVVGQIEQAFGARATELPGGIVLLG